MATISIGLKRNTLEFLEDDMDPSPARTAGSGFQKKQS